MELSCSRKALLGGLKIVERALHACPASIPVLGNVMLVAGKDGLELWATDLQIAIKYKVETQEAHVEEGAITVPGRFLRRVIATLSSENVEMKVVPPATLAIQCAGAKINIKGLDAENFPNMPGIPTGPWIEFDPTKLSLMIRQTIFATSSPKRPILSGALFQLRDKELTMVAADGYRLSVGQDKLLQQAGEPISIIIPHRALSELVRLLDPKAKEPVLFYFEPQTPQVFFRFAQVTLISLLVEGHFPDYKVCIPKKEKIRTVTVVKTAQFMEAVKIVRVLSSSKVVHLHIIPTSEKGSLIEVTATGREGDFIRAQVDAKTEGEEMRLAFNGKYLSQVLSVVGAENTEFSATSRSGGALVRPCGMVNFLHLLMPMNVSPLA